MVDEKSVAIRIAATFIALKETKEIRLKMKIIYCSFLFLIWSQAHALELTGRVEKIHDGDTVILRTTDRQRYKIRLEGIDAPELDQAFGQESKKHLSQLLDINSTHIKVVYERRDDYGRILGTLYGSPRVSKVPVNINGAMVTDGYAWVIRKYGKEYIQMQEYARAQRLGLWKQPSPVPPWDWRWRQKQTKK